MTQARFAAVAVSLCVLALHLVPERGREFSSALPIWLSACTAWAVALRGVARGAWRPSLAEALIVVVALRVAACSLSPAWSDDIYRYLFEGRLVLEGVNPFLHAPLDVDVAHLRSTTWELINNKGISAAYPPAVQYANALGVSLAGDVSTLGVQIVYAAFDLLTFLALWRLLPGLGVPAVWALFHGLCPLVAVEFGAEGHSDSLTIAALVGAMWFAQRGWAVRAGVALGVAVAGKYMPIVFLPFLARDCAKGRPGACVLACGVTVGLLWTPFLWGGAEIFEGATQYAVRWRGNDSMFAVLHTGLSWVSSAGWIGGFEVQKVAKLPILLAGVYVLLRAWWRGRSAAEAALAFFLFFVACAPTLHPWYVAFLIPFLPLVPHPGWFAFGGSVVLAYHVLPGWIETRSWAENGWVKLVEYLPFYVALVAVLRRGPGAGPRDLRGRGAASRPIAPPAIGKPAAESATSPARP